jgi:hypothetical protein
MGSYFGSKATCGLCQPIIALMPPHDTYIETHLGGGAMMQRKPPALRSIGIDRNERALARFHCDYPVEEVHGCAHRFLAQFPFTGRELVYSDPPYLHETRSSERRYRFEYTEQAHRELLALLKGLPCAVILSRCQGLWRAPPRSPPPTSPAGRPTKKTSSAPLTGLPWELVTVPDTTSTEVWADQQHRHAGTPRGILDLTPPKVPDLTVRVGPDAEALALEGLEEHAQPIQPALAPMAVADEHHIAAGRQGSGRLPCYRPRKKAGARVRVQMAQTRPSRA